MRQPDAQVSLADADPVVFNCNSGISASCKGTTSSPTTAATSSARPGNSIQASA
jgi:hypothetical protein